MIYLTLRQQQRLQTLCQNKRMPEGYSRLRWVQLRQGYLATLDEIDLEILWEALGSEFFRAMTRSQDELEQ